MRTVTAAFTAVSEGRFDDLASLLAAEIDWRRLADESGHIPRCRGRAEALERMRIGLLASGEVSVSAFVEEGDRVIAHVHHVGDDELEPPERFVVAEVHEGQITELCGYATEPEALAALHAATAPAPTATPTTDRSRIPLVSDLAGRVRLRALSSGDVGALMRIHRTPEVRRWWGEPEPDFPWSDDSDANRLVIEVEGAVAGMIQFSEELEPRYRHASIDLFLDPSLHGRGLGTDALRQLVRHLIDERGHHRLTIDPAADNTAAIRSYEKAGFRSVGVMRQYERDVDSDRWHDGLLMELLAQDARGLPHAHSTGVGG